MHMAIIYSESFETDGNGTRYTTSVPEFSDGFGDFFTRTDGSTIGSFYEVTGADGDFYFAAQDLDGEGAIPPLTLDITGIDITGVTNLGLSFLAAEDDEGTNQDWDASDFVHISVQIDGGGYVDILNFESVPDGDEFNAVPGVDTDFDGDGDGTELTDVFQTFTAAIAGSGSTLDLRIEYQLDAGDEDFAIDLIEINGLGGGTGPVPGVTAVPSGLSLSEAGETQTLSLSLDTEPASPVRIILSGNAQVGFSTD
ncbi:MAG: hypothetical protein AAFV62_11600, partial [Pseudomonadota bacterium]